MGPQRQGQPKPYWIPQLLLFIRIFKNRLFFGRYRNLSSSNNLYLFELDAGGWENEIGLQIFQGLGHFQIQHKPQMPVLSQGSELRAVFPATENKPVA